MSVVQICNVALARIGHTNLIMSLAEKSAAAQNCTLFYEFCRDSVLADSEWGLGRRAQALAALTTVSLPGWTYAYRYPEECVTARMVVPESGLRLAWISAWDRTSITLPSGSRIPWTVGSDDAGRVIFTDLEQAFLIYTARVTDPGTFSSQFQDALSWRLAVELAMALTKDRRVVDMVSRQYQLALDVAKRGSMNEQGQDQEPDSISVTGRF